jgi:DhnA family fructose-bisphosphate aldolase class Ia
MSTAGKERRLGRIFGPDGRVLIVPIDHGLMSGAIRGLERPEETLETLIASGADAILAGYGVAKKFHRFLGGAGLILRLDGGPSDFGLDLEATDLMGTVEDAIRIGADAVITSTWLGGPHEARAAAAAMRLAAACDAWGMPLMVETFMSSGFQPTIENIAMAARIACELGADVIKTYLAGDAAAYKRVTGECFAPVVILGGEKTNDELAVLRWAKTAIDAGAAGTCIGRNVLQHQNPGGVTKALRAIIHEGAAVEQVACLIGGGN